MASTPLSAHAKADRPLQVVTIGASLTSRNHWQPELQKRLSACLHREVRVTRVAAPGVTSRWGLGAMDQAVALRPDVVTIDFAGGDANLLKGVGPRESLDNARTMVRRLRKEFPGSRIFLLAMNPSVGMAQFTRPRLDLYYRQYQQLAREEGATFVDHRPLWRKLGPDTLRRAIPDGRHPDPDYARRIVAPHMAAQIAGKPC